MTDEEHVANESSPVRQRVPILRNLTDRGSGLRYPVGRSQPFDFGPVGCFKILSGVARIYLREILPA